MSARRPWQFSLRDLLLLTLYAAICAWTLRQVRLDDLRARILLLDAMVLMQGVVWQSVIHDIQSGKRGEAHETAKVFMAIAGGLPWLAWIVVAALLNTRSGPEVLLVIAGVFLVLCVVGTIVSSLASIGYCLGCKLPSRYPLLAGLNIAVIFTLLGALVPPMAVARE
jgi:hypothetical protein